jgi:hypothetical protein
MAHQVEGEVRRRVRERLWEMAFLASRQISPLTWIQMMCLPFTLVITDELMSREVSSVSGGGGRWVDLERHSADRVSVLFSSVDVSNISSLFFMHRAHIKGTLRYQIGSITWSFNSTTLTNEIKATYKVIKTHKRDLQGIAGS